MARPSKACGYATPGKQLCLQRTLIAQLFSDGFPCSTNGRKGSKKLRGDTIPFLFKYGLEPKKARLSSESRPQKQNHKQVSTITHLNVYHPVLFCKSLVLFDLLAWRTLRDCGPVRIR